MIEYLAPATLKVGYQPFQNESSSGKWGGGMRYIIKIISIPESKYIDLVADVIVPTVILFLLIQNVYLNEKLMSVSSKYHTYNISRYNRPVRPSHIMHPNVQLRRLGAWHTSINQIRPVECITCVIKDHGYDPGRVAEVNEIREDKVGYISDPNPSPLRIDD